MNNTWGFKRDDDHWKSTETLIRNLCDIASKGGNYLLNVGPTSEGVIPRPSVERLAAIGAWMRTNSEAIYGTGPTLFGAEAGQFSETDKDKNGKPRFVTAWDWRCTTRPGRIYIHIFKWPTDGRFELPAVKDRINRAYLLADPGRHPLEFKQSELGVSLTLPAAAPDPVASVVCLETR
jgi:alpha-L-fucosidase